MSIQAVGWALEQDLPPGPKLVLVSIANHADHTDGYCWLKAETIAKEASCLPRSVYRILAALARNGFLRREKRKGGDGKQRANDYWILFDREPAEWAWKTESGEDGDPQDVGDINAPSDIGTPGEPSDLESPGPSDSDGIHSYTEPSKTKPRETNFGLAGRKPRGYRAPPLAVVAETKPKLVFVIKGSPAWHAWIEHRRKNGLPPINMAYGGAGEHAGKTGLHFPTLFPKTESTGPPESLCTDEDLRDFAQSKIG